MAPRRRAPRIVVVGLSVVIAAIAAVAGCDLVPPSSAAARIDVPHGEHPGAPPSMAAPPIDTPRREHRGALGLADGAVPAGTTVFDDEVPGVANVDPALLAGLRGAAAAAARDGVELFIESGWRSAAYQDQLFRAAVAEYGSVAEAARWVATPDTSPHVSGDAVDIGSARARAWLSEHGAAFGLCQIYRNEPWHFELRPDAIDHGCPSRYADPTQDPRMRQ